MTSEETGRETGVIERSAPTDDIRDAFNSPRGHELVEDLPRIDIREDWIAKDPARGVEVLLIAVLLGVGLFQLVHVFWP